MSEVFKEFEEEINKIDGDTEVFGIRVMECFGDRGCEDKRINRDL